MREHLYKFENYPDREFPVYLSVQKGREYLAGLHFHDDIEVMEVLSGTVMLRAGTERILCNAGEVVYIPPLVFHEILSRTEDAAIRGLVFDPILLRSEVLQNDYSALFRESSLHRFCSESSLTEELRTILGFTAQAYPGSDDISRAELLSGLFRFLSIFLRGDVVKKERRLSANDTRIRPAIDYIEKNYSRKVAVSDLSTILSVCDDHCIRLFTAAVSKTPAEYITDVRLRHALQLLADRQYSVQMVSELCGFSNVSYFSKVFKQKLEMSPSDFRNRLPK